MEIALTKEIEAIIADRLRSGRCRDADEVMRDALEALRQRDEFESPELEAALLEGVRSPHRPYGPDVLAGVREAAGGRQ